MDFPDITEQVCGQIRSGDADRGILVFADYIVLAAAFRNRVTSRPKVMT